MSGFPNGYCVGMHTHIWHGFNGFSNGTPSLNGKQAEKDHSFKSGKMYK